MVFNQMEHLVKMVNDLLSNATWSITLCIYILLIHPPICLIIYLLTYYPSTYLLLTYLPTYIFAPLYNLPTILPIYLHTTYLLIH